MQLVLGVLGGLFVAMAAVGVVYWLAAAVFVRRALADSTPGPVDPVPVTILKPLHGAEPGLADNLATFARQDYGAPLQIVCGVQDPADPAKAIAEGLALPRGVDLDVIVDPAVHGSNRKIANLINMMRQARHDLLIISDADIAVPPDYLKRVVAALSQPGAATTRFR